MKRLVLIGGGHAHMVTLQNIHLFVSKGYQVSVIQPSEYHYYSGMGPGMLGMTYSADDIRFATRKVVERQGGSFVLGKASIIDTERQVVLLHGSDQAVPYDVLSCNAGSSVPTGIVADAAAPDIFLVKPIESLLAAQRRILELCREKTIDIAVVGGGPSSVEIGGNIWRLCRKSSVHQPRIRIIAGRKLLPKVPEKIGAMARRSLQGREIEVLENLYVERISPGAVVLKSGERLSADLIFVALGVKPSSIFADSHLPVGADGGLLVNDYLQSVGHENIFGGGDCISLQGRSLDKVGVYAVRENPILFHNLMATLDGAALRPFDPGGAYLLIYNLGDDTGIFCKWSIIFGGSLAFRIKDYIDRKFMARFQAMEHTL